VHAVNLHTGVVGVGFIIYPRSAAKITIWNYLASTDAQNFASSCWQPTV